MEWRKAEPGDLAEILAIIRRAQAYFRANGIDQWQNGYLDRETIRADIARGAGYVLDRGAGPASTVAVLPGPEPDYAVLRGGEWRTGGDYAVIHRIAVDPQYKRAGLASAMLREIERLCLGKGLRGIRADTHADNLPMRNLLEKNGFGRCGFIELHSGGLRVAYEKRLSKP